MLVLRRSFGAIGRSSVLMLLLALSAGAADLGLSAGSPGPTGVRHIELPGIHNAFAVTTNLFSGSVPESDAAFAALARLGVKTVISVDGARPDVEAAHRHGLRYVHVPHGYDGIGTNAQAQLIQATRTLPGPVFLHCHHGKHRGPAAAALICRANAGWSAEDATAFMALAGTATNYAGLYATIRKFRAPTEELLRSMGTEFPGIAKVAGLVEAMVRLDVWTRTSTRSRRPARAATRATGTSMTDH